MKKIIFILFTFFCLQACTKFGKNITIKGRVVNPVTGAGIPDAAIHLFKSGVPTEYNGSFKSVKDVTTDANGNYELNHLGGTSQYYVRLNHKENEYYLGTLINGKYNQAVEVKKGKTMWLDWHVLPYGYVSTHTQNINCQGPSDSMQVRGKTDYTPYTSFGYIYRTGCYDNTSTTPSKVPMGYRYYETKVIRSGVTTYVYDTIFVSEGGTSYLEILY